MRKFLLTLALLLLATPAFAQVEFGMKAGLNVVDGNVAVAIPTQAVNVALFIPSNLIVRTEIGAAYADLGDGNVFDFAGTVRLEYHFSGNDAGSPFAALAGSLLYADLGAESLTDYAVGGVIGYRFLPLDFLSLSVEGGYAYLFDPEEGAISAGIGVGILP